MWLEHLARSAPTVEPYPFPFTDGELDFRPLLFAVSADRLRGRDQREIARAFQLGVAQGVAGAANSLSRARRVGAVILSGGVFQNALLLSDLGALLVGTGLEVLTNRRVPPNDGGISLGQAALAAFRTAGSIERNAGSTASGSYSPDLIRSPGP
jgi:hydrogenase maturation protein HypF